MGYLIVTARSLLWILSSLLATLVMLGAIMNPAWLVSAEKSVNFGNNSVSYTPSVGVYTKCSKPIRYEELSCTVIAVRGLLTDSEVYPTVWKAALVFLVLGK